MVQAVWIPSGAALYIYQEYALLQIGTRSVMTLDVARTTNQPAKHLGFVVSIGPVSAKHEPAETAGSLR